MIRAPSLSILLFFTFFLIHINAASQDIQPLCEESADQCLAKICAQQSYLDENTPPWWALQVRRFDILFNVQRFDELYGLLRPWLENTNSKALPEYKPVVSLFFGKWLRANGRENEAIVALTEALTGLKAQYEKMPTPEVGTRVLNLLGVLGKTKETQDFAVRLEGENYDAPIFYKEIFAELGHLALREGDNAKHIEYRIKSLHWALKLPNLQQQAVAYSNYAVALRNNENYEEAEKAFLKGLACAEQAKDVAQVNSIKLRIAENATLDNDAEKARHWLKRVSVEGLPPLQLARYRNLVRENAPN